MSTLLITLGILLIFFLGWTLKITFETLEDARADNGRLKSILGTLKAHHDVPRTDCAACVAVARLDDLNLRLEEED